MLLDKTRTKLGLLLQTDQAQIKMLLQTYPWPKCMGSVNTLVLIKELTDLDKSALTHMTGVWVVFRTGLLVL